MDNGGNHISALLDSKMEHIVVRHFHTVVHGTVWVLTNKRCLGELVERVEKQVAGVIELFPAARPKQQILAEEELEEILAGVGGEEKSKLMSLLKDVTSSTEASEQEYGYEVLSIDDSATLSIGDCYLHNAINSDHTSKHHYESVIVTSKARAREGDVYGATKDLLND